MYKEAELIMKQKSDVIFYITSIMFFLVFFLFILLFSRLVNT